MHRHPVRATRFLEPQGELQVVPVVEMSADEFLGEIAESYPAPCAPVGDSWLTLGTRTLSSTPRPSDSKR